METPYVLIDLGALSHNAKALLANAGEFYCVLKCDAYGHGAIECAERLYSAGMKRFAVYSLSEAIKIRSYAPNAEILILGRTEPCLFRELETRGLIQTVGSAEYAAQIAESGHRIKVHIELDCGMNRWGIKWSDAGTLDLPLPSEDILGVFAHLSCADAGDLTLTETQKARFEQGASELEKSLGKSLVRHLRASAGMLRLTSDGKTLSRAGLALYGIAPENCDGSFLQPVMSFHSSVVGVRTVRKGENVGYGTSFPAPQDMVIATISGGYANGIPRRASGKLTVLIGGEPSLSFGNICMDRFMVDVTPIFEKGSLVRVGDTVTFFSPNFPITQMSLACETIPYELLTLIGNNNRRIFFEKEYALS